MPDDASHARGRGALLSVDAVARMTRVTPDRVMRLAAEAGIAGRLVGGTWHLSSQKLQAVLDRLAAEVGAADRYYPIPKYLERCTSPWAVTLVHMYRQPFVYPASMAPEQGDLLRTLVCNLRPRTILEIGCFVGVSTIWLAAGLEQRGGEGLLHSIDRFDPVVPSPPGYYHYLHDPLSFARGCATSARLSHRVRFHQGDSRELGGGIRRLIGEPLDLLLLDGDHTIEGCLGDFELYVPHLVPGGYIVLHDIYPQTCGWEGPRYLIDRVLRPSSRFDIVELSTSPHNFGMALIRRRPKP